MDIDQIFKFLISTAAVTSVIIYLAKLFVDKYAESRIEKYKSSLDKESEKFRHQLITETEKFRHDLNISSVEHQIKYTKLYEERGQVIKEIYLVLLALQNALSQLTTRFQGHEWTVDVAREDLVRDRLNKLRTSIDVNRIFFSQSLCEKIEFIITDAALIVAEMSIAKSGERRNEKYNKAGVDQTTEQLLEPSKVWHELDEKVQGELKTAMLDLAQEFRVLIGVS